MTENFFNSNATYVAETEKCSRNVHTSEVKRRKISLNASNRDCLNETRDDLLLFQFELLNGFYDDLKIEVEKNGRQQVSRVL
jgi:hypothetical protein